MMVQRAIDYDIDMMRNRIVNAVLEARDTAPEDPVEGQMYVDTADDGAMMIFLNGEWVVCSGKGAEAKRVMFGNGTDTEYIVSHGLDTYDILFSVRTTNDAREYVFPRVQAISKNQVKVFVDSPPGTNGMVINIIPAKSQKKTLDVEIYEFAEPAEEWFIPNDAEMGAFVQMYDMDGDNLMGDITEPTSDFNPIVIEYSGQRTGWAIVAYTDLVQSYNDEEVWMFRHNTDSLMAVQAFDENDGEMFADIQQDGNTVVVSFSKGKTGTLILRKPTMVVEFTDSDEWVFEHGLGRFVAVQMYTEGYDQLFGDVSQDGERVTVQFSRPRTGYLLVI